MFWSLNYQPQTHWPLSGSVMQDISPLLMRAGNAGVEERALREVASYGRQIGVLSDLVHALAALQPPGSLDAQGEHAREQLADLRQRIDELKQDAPPIVPSSPEQARKLLNALLERHPDLRAALPPAPK
jgi:hypothetical protein